MNMWWEFRFFVRLPSAEETEGLIDVAKQAVLTAVADGCGASSSGLQFGSKPEVRTDVYYALDDARGLKVRCKGKRASSGEPYDESFELKTREQLHPLGAEEFFKATGVRLGPDGALPQHARAGAPEDASSSSRTKVDRERPIVVHKRRWQLHTEAAAAAPSGPSAPLLLEVAELRVPEPQAPGEEEGEGGERRWLTVCVESPSAEAAGRLGRGALGAGLSELSAALAAGGGGGGGVLGVLVGGYPRWVCAQGGAAPASAAAAAGP